MRNLEQCAKFCIFILQNYGLEGRKSIYFNIEYDRFTFFITYFNPLFVFGMRYSNFFMFKKIFWVIMSGWGLTLAQYACASAQNFVFVFSFCFADSLNMNIFKNFGRWRLKLLKLKVFKCFIRGLRPSRFFLVLLFQVFFPFAWL